MEKSVRYLLDGVVGFTCVDPSVNPFISAAPFVVSIIVQQCFYVCRTASSCQALLNDGGSSFWRIMRHVAVARERFVKLNTLTTEQRIIPKKSVIDKKQHRKNFSDFEVGDDDGDVGNNVFAVLSRPAMLFHQQQQGQLLSPLDFRVVVVGGGRVGRAIVERLLNSPELIHPSRITIITRQPESVAQFAARGVQCTGRCGGRKALVDCHVLVVACQQTQFYDFSSTYCARSTHNTFSLATNQEKNDHTEQVGPKKEVRPCHSTRRTLRDVVNKWRTMKDDDYDGFLQGVTAMTRLLKPGTFVFSCCAALGTHKIARELGHLDPLVVTADVNLNAVHFVASQADNSRELVRSNFIERAALERNTFLRMLTLLEQETCLGDDKASSLSDIFSHDFAHSMLLCRDVGSFHGGLKHFEEPLQDNVYPSIETDVIGGTTRFLLRVWRALRCFVVSRVVFLKPAEQRLFMYLQRTGPLLCAVLVALPSSFRAQVVNVLLEQLLKINDSIDKDKADEANDQLQLVKVDHRNILAYDSDDDAEDYKEVTSEIRELARLVRCFPTVFKSEKEALQQLQSEFVAVTRQGSRDKRVKSVDAVAATASTTTAVETKSREREEKRW